MRIGELAHRTGISRSRIRFYEKEGLLPRVERQSNGYRDYPAAIIDTLSFIERSQAIGFSLSEIRYALPKASEGKMPAEFIVSSLKKKLADIDMHIRNLQDMRKHILKLIDENEVCAEKEKAEPNRV